MQRWWGEAVVAKVRRHVPVDYFRVAEPHRSVYNCLDIGSSLFDVGHKYCVARLPLSLQQRHPIQHHGERRLRRVAADDREQKLCSVGAHIPARS